MSEYITGDLHRDVDRLRLLLEKVEMNQDDIVIILGDAGFNYYLDKRDDALKQEAQDLNVTLFMIHGNHEQRPYLIDTYQEKIWHNGIVYYQEAYPNLLFAKDGEIYEFNGKNYLVIGGGYSVDKQIRLLRNYPYFESELPTDEVKQFIWEKLEKINWQVHGIFTHVAPLTDEPTWAFLSGVDQSKVDKSLEIFLEKIKNKLTYQVWYAGHYHIDFISELRFLFYRVERLQ